MFSDSDIAKEFSMGADKLRYVVNQRIAPYFHKILKEEVSACSCCVIIFDESLNDVTQSSQMDVLVRFWDNSSNNVKVRFWDSSFLGHARHSDLLEHFNKSICTLNLSKMLQVSMDGPSVNIKFTEALSKR